MTDPVNSDAALVREAEADLRKHIKAMRGTVWDSYAESAEESLNVLAAAAERADALTEYENSAASQFLQTLKRAEEAEDELGIVKTEWDLALQRAERAEAALLAAQQERDEARGEAAAAKRDRNEWKEAAERNQTGAEATITRLREIANLLMMRGHFDPFVPLADLRKIIGPRTPAFTDRAGEKKWLAEIAALAQDAEQESAPKVWIDGSPA